MNPKSVYAFAAYCSLAVPICYLTAACGYLFMPYQPKSAGFLLVSYSLALAALFSLAIVPAIFESIRAMHEAFARWICAIAYLCYGFTAVDLGIPNAGHLPGVFTIGDLDPEGLFSFGLVGAFWLVVTIIALKQRIWPVTLVLFGFVGSSVFMINYVAFVLRSIQTQRIMAYASIIIAPIFYVLLGLFFRKTASADVS